MTSLALAAWLATAAQLPIATQAQLPTGETAELAAEQLLFEPSKQILTLRGNCLLKTERVTLRADELTYDQQAQIASAKGKVMLIANGQFVAVADEIQVDIRSLEATVKGGLFMQKKGVDAAALLAAKTPDELKKLGQNVVTLSGERIRKTGENQFAVEGLSFTPCDCKPTDPSWRVEADRADVRVGDRAILTWPKVYVYDVPVLALPWAYLPIAERRSGLLVPKPSYGLLNGFGIEQPIYVTLGESYDVTVTPGYFFGGRKVKVGTVLRPPFFGIQGPRLHTEFRYAPTDAIRGRLAVAGIYDLHPRRDPIRAELLLPGEPQRGLRGEGTFQHTQDMGNGWQNRADVSLVSDGWYTRDLQADVLLKEVQYLRSTAALFHRSDDAYAGVDLTFRQDLRYGFDLFRRDRMVTGAETTAPIRGANTFQRLPGITFGLPEKRLAGPLFGGFNAELARISPLNARFGDEGTDGLYNVAGPETYLANGQGNGVYEPGERESRLRLDLRPHFSAETTVGRFARLRPYAALRDDLYLGELTGKLSHRGYALVGLAADTELARTFGPAEGRFRHTLTPVVDVRMVPFVIGAAPSLYDEVDAAITTRAGLAQPGFLHASTAIQQRLSFKANGVARELARLELGQTYDLGYRSVPRLGDTYAVLWVGLDRVSLENTTRYSFDEQRLTQLSVNLNLNDGKGNVLYGRYDRLAVDGGDRLRRGLDTLVGTKSLIAEAAKRSDAASIAQLLVAGGRYQHPIGFGVRYEIVLQPGFTVQNATDPTKDAIPSPVAQQVLGISYGPACDCWRLEATAIMRRDPTGGLTFPDFGATLTLSRFGSFGAGG